MAVNSTFHASSYVSRLELLLEEIDYHYSQSSPPSMKLVQSHHSWMHETLGPMTLWTKKQLDILEDMSFTYARRSYPFADDEMSALMAKLTALVFFIDDSLENDVFYSEICSFAHYVFIGGSQSSGILDLYHGCIKELSYLYEGDAVLRGIAVVPWISFIDGCLLEKRLLTVDTELRASPYDMGYQHLVTEQSRGVNHVARDILPEARIHFSFYIRFKTGVGEAYAAPIFKATKEQGLPLSRYITALPDITFYIVVINDLLSFHKEELAGETVNMIHVRTRSLKEHAGTGASGEWTVLDTFSLLCDEARAATYRIDEILRVKDYERIVRDGLDSQDLGLSEADLAIARQWREFRDGYISWHLETPRYKLDFIRFEKFQSD